MRLIDKYLPRYQFTERHTRRIAASPATVVAAVHAYNPECDLFFRSMIALRELPMRLLGQATHTPVEPFGLHNFTLLEQDEDRELVYGLAGQFWKLNYGQTPIADGPTFLAFNRPATARLVLCFTTQKLDRTRTLLTTETRVFCQDQEALRRFTPYWYLIRPVSGLIRRRILSGICRVALQLRVEH